MAPIPLGAHPLISRGNFELLNNFAPKLFSELFRGVITWFMRFGRYRTISRSQLWGPHRGMCVRARPSCPRPWCPGRFRRHLTTRPHVRPMTSGTTTRASRRPHQRHHPPKTKMRFCFKGLTHSRVWNPNRRCLPRRCHTTTFPLEARRLGRAGSDAVTTSRDAFRRLRCAGRQPGALYGVCATGDHR